MYKSAGWGWRSGGERGGGAEEREVDANPSQSFLMGGVTVSTVTCTSGLIYALKILANTHAHIETQQNTGFSRFGLLFASFLSSVRIVCVNFRSRKELPSSPNKDEDFRDHIFLFCPPT